MAEPLYLLSGGAAQGLVRAVQERFEAQHGCEIRAQYGAVGAMRERLLAGEPCDLVILSETLVRELQAQGHVAAGSDRAVGRVQTGVAVKSGEPVPDISTPAALKSLLESADAIYFPDPAKATAGIHFMKVLRELGIAGSHAERLRTFPNGATAMAALASATERRPVGCTQFTEILYTPGVQLVGALPAPHELATTYTAGVCTLARNARHARDLVELVCSAQSAPLRKAGGFSDAP
jgi:molybdate transport system substrate-binding protein